MSSPSCESARRTQRSSIANMAEVAAWGLPLDEFEDSAHWPPQLYVREAARMRGARVLTQRDVFGDGHGDGKAQREATSVGTSKWLVDVHAVKRVAVRKILRMEKAAHVVPVALIQFTDFPSDIMVIVQLATTAGGSGGDWHVFDFVVPADRGNLVRREPVNQGFLHLLSELRLSPFCDPRAQGLVVELTGLARVAVLKVWRHSPGKERQGSSAPQAVVDLRLQPRHGLNAASVRGNLFVRERCPILFSHKSLVLVDRLA